MERAKIYAGWREILDSILVDEEHVPLDVELCGVISKAIDDLAKRHPSQILFVTMRPRHENHQTCQFRFFSLFSRQKGQKVESMDYFFGITRILPGTEKQEVYSKRYKDLPVFVGNPITDYMRLFPNEIPTWPLVTMSVFMLAELTKLGFRQVICLPGPHTLTTGDESETLVGVFRKGDEYYSYFLNIGALLADTAHLASHQMRRGASYRKDPNE